LTSDTFRVAVIPHTAAVTTLGARKPGDKVNIEIDVLAKHVERLIETHGAEVGVTGAGVRRTGARGGWFARWRR